MAYYIRLLTCKDANVSTDSIAEDLKENKIKAFLKIENEESENWDELTVLNSKSNEIFILERNDVKNNSIAINELNELNDEIENYKPITAVKWLKEYFKKVKTIYAFQLLNNFFDDEKNWDILACIKEKLWNDLDGIFQADNEGFTNTYGYHILWQFTDDVQGDWNMSVLQDKQWHNFKMNLGSKVQRKAFWDGQVPDKIDIIGTDDVEDFYIESIIPQHRGGEK